MRGCEVRADAPGYRSDSITLDERRTMENPDIGTIVLHRLANVHGLSVSATAFKAPREARKAYDKGLDAMHKGRSAEAEKDFEKAVRLYPQYANAWLDLGKVKLRSNEDGLASEAFQKALDAALQLDPVDFPRAWFADAVANFI